MAISSQIFAQIVIILGYLFSGLFTTYYIVTEKWYQNYTDFEECLALPSSLILCQVVNLTLVVFLVGYNVYRGVCKALTNAKITMAFNCCSLIYALLIVGSYAFAIWVYFSDTCYNVFINQYPHLWLCLQVLLLTLIIVISLVIVGSITLTIINKKKKKAKVVNTQKELDMV